jgi:signal transduction histidine kinase
VTAPETLPEELDIRRGFAAFIEASERLEASYAELQARAVAVDLQLAASNQQLEQTLIEREMVFAALPVGLISLTKAGVCRWRNPEAERLSALVAAAGHDLVGIDAGQLEVGGLSVRVRHVAMPDGGSLLLVEDRSKVRQLEREVDRLDRMAGLSELALGIAHEIKNPLNGVMGFAALLQRSVAADKQRQYAARIAEGLGQVDGIVKALLAFARPADKVMQPAPIRLVLTEAAAAAGLPTTRIVTEYFGDADATMQVDAPVLVRVLSNLFRNSAEAGVDDVKIRVTCELAHPHLAITVQDDGPGVPVEVAERIFQPFFSTKDRGHGLGLALACRVLSFLDGGLELCNPGEPGARFRITTPVVASVAAQEVGVGT